MKIFATDTSGKTACAAIVDEYITIGEININTQKKMTHSEILLPMIDRLFDFTGCRIGDMDYVACVNGPGSFTGLRIGAATALGLAKGAEKPVVPVPALDALAYSITSVPGADLYIMPMMDARRAQVYTAVYKNAAFPVPETAYFALPVAEALEILFSLPGFRRGAHVIFTGDGAHEYRADIENIFHSRGMIPVFTAQNANRQRAASVALRAMRMIEEGYVPSPFSLAYIRKSQAERVLSEKNAAVHH